MTPNGSTPTVSPIAQIRALHDRLVRAEALVAANKVHPIYGMADHYIVEGSNARYLVNGECLCPDATNRTELLKGVCKHRFAALLYAEQAAQTSKSKATDNGVAPQNEELEAKIDDLYR